MHPLYNRNPSMFRAHPILFVLSVLLIVFYGLGILILGVWWLNCRGTLLTIASDRVTLRKGILSKNTNEIYHDDIRNVRISQGPLQRLLGTGRVSISSAGQSDMEIDVPGMPTPGRVREILDERRRASRASA